MLGKIRTAAEFFAKTSFAQRGVFRQIQVPAEYRVQHTNSETAEEKREKRLVRLHGIVQSRIQQSGEPTSQNHLPRWAVQDTLDLYAAGSWPKSREKMLTQHREWFPDTPKRRTQTEHGAILVER